MIDTNATAEIVRAYYDALGSGAGSFDHERLRAILAPDLVFEGPIAGRRVGAEGFIKGVSGFVESMQDLTMLYQLTHGDLGATLYDAKLTGGTVRFAEFFEVSARKIQSLRLLYDAGEYRARGGR